MIEQVLFERALDLWKNEGHRLPHDVYPGRHLFQTHYDGQGEAQAVSEAGWQAYQWNPPGYRDHAWPVADPSASAKPTWKQLTAYALAVARQDAIEALRLWTREQISHRVFQSHDLLDEALDAAANRHTDQQKARRDQVVAAYRQARERLRSAEDLPALETVHADGMAQITALLESFAAGDTPA